MKGAAAVPPSTTRSSSRDLRLCQAIVDRVLREAMVVLLSGEPFFLGRRDDVSVTNQGGRTIVIVSRDSENVHALSRVGNLAETHALSHSQAACSPILMAYVHPGVAQCV
jgi:hypothetical protein